MHFWQRGGAGVFNDDKNEDGKDSDDKDDKDDNNNKCCYMFASAPFEKTWTHIISLVAAKNE